MIRTTGFFRNKAKSLIGMSTAVGEEHGGTVPDTLDALTPLPGVGRKTANGPPGNGDLGLSLYNGRQESPVAVSP